MVNFALQVNGEWQIQEPRTKMPDIRYLLNNFELATNKPATYYSKTLRKPVQLHFINVSSDPAQ